MSENTAILVTPCNLSEQLYSDVTAALKLLSADGHVFKLNDRSNNSHLLIIDVDSEAGREKLNQSMPGQVKLLISSNAESGKNIISIQKPANIETINNVLCKLFNMMHAHLLKINVSKKEDVADGESITDTLFYKLLQAKNDKQILYVASNEIEFYVDGNNQSLKSKNNLEEIRSLLVLPYSDLTINSIDNKLFLEKANNLNVLTLHNILWAAAINCSNGNLLPEHDINRPVKLRAWPSFTRNDFKPDHLKLAALLAQRALSLSQLETQTSIPFADIVNFYNAAFSVDLIDQNISTEINDTQYTKPIQTRKKSTLLTKIAARLGFNQRVYGASHG